MSSGCYVFELCDVLKRSCFGGALVGRDGAMGEGIGGEGEGLVGGCVGWWGLGVLDLIIP